MHINFCWSDAEVSQSSSLLLPWDIMGTLWVMGLCNHHAEHLDCQEMPPQRRCCPLTQPAVHAGKLVPKQKKTVVFD